MNRSLSKFASVAAVLIASTAAAVSVHAQVAPAKSTRAKVSRKAATCAPVDTNAVWYRRQHEWLDERTATWSNESFRTALLGTSGLDAASSNGAMLGYEITDAATTPMTAADSAMIVRLKALAAERGSTWPTKSVVGARGVLAVWALTARDTTFARVALKRMMEAGPDESPPAAVAILDDRQRLRAGRKQLHGTQLHRSATGVLEPLPLEDEAHLALRRDGAELPPLATSLCAARGAGSK